ncbi:MAG TPA: HupE/UreJ family protein [Steroidobacteraceae bacterium]|nr:HupE/UreJ family protein [Steroidobacteraceae bacterium]
MKTAFALLLTLLTAPFAAAHDVRPAYLEIVEQANGTLNIVWKRTAATSAASFTPRFSTGWTDKQPATSHDAGEALVKTWTIAAPHAPLAGASIDIEGLKTTITDVLLRVRYADGSELTRVLKPAESSITLPGAAKPGAPVREYLGLGFSHIWSGIDHLMYVFGLVLLVRTPRLLLKTITGFTLAHSVSLAAASLGFLHVPAAPVEAVIALSIVYVAVELLRAREGQPSLASRAPWVVSMSIGLLHGLGFAGALAEVGLPADAIPQALLLFNVGIELGQIAFVALVLAAGQALIRLAPRLTTSLRWLPPYAIGSFATFWVIERVHAIF